MLFYHEQYGESGRAGSCGVVHHDHRLVLRVVGIGVGCACHMVGVHHTLDNFCVPQTLPNKVFPTHLPSLGVHEKDMLIEGVCIAQMHISHH